MLKLNIVNNFLVESNIDSEAGKHHGGVPLASPETPSIMCEDDDDDEASDLMGGEAPAPPDGIPSLQTTPDSEDPDSLVFRNPKVASLPHGVSGASVWAGAALNSINRSNKAAQGTASNVITNEQSVKLDDFTKLLAQVILKSNIHARRYGK